jgi:small subunit ribosomal protein S13
MARIAGVNLPVQKHVGIGLQAIFGIGRSRSKKVCVEAGVNPATKIKDLTEAERSPSSPSKAICAARSASRSSA